jgi:uncharacterized membrane protein
VKKPLFATWRTNFLTGLALLLPAFVTLAIVKWLFISVASVTDMLLFFLPKEWTHANDGAGDMFWYYSLAALVLAMLLVSLVGSQARYYVGKKMIAWLDATMLRVPLLNKIYGTTKQVNEAFSTGKNTAFKTVVLVEFPRKGIYSIGFITGEQYDEIQAKTKEHVVCVFVPTTPNPTSGWLVLIPTQDVTRLKMSVADAIKFVISLGSVAPGYVGQPVPPPPGVTPPAMTQAPDNPQSAPATVNLPG